MSEKEKVREVFDWARRRFPQATVELRETERMLIESADGPKPVAAMNDRARVRQLFGALHQIAATSDEETGPAISRIADELEAALAGEPGQPPSVRGLLAYIQETVSHAMCHADTYTLEEAQAALCRIHQKLDDFDVEHTASAPAGRTTEPVAAQTSGDSMDGEAQMVKPPTQVGRTGGSIPSPVPNSSSGEPTLATEAQVDTEVELARYAWLKRQLIAARVDRQKLLDRIATLERALNAVYQDLGEYQLDRERAPVGPYAYHRMEAALAGEPGQPPSEMSPHKFVLMAGTVSTCNICNRPLHHALHGVPPAGRTTEPVAAHWGLPGGDCFCMVHGRLSKPCSICTEPVAAQTSGEPYHEFDKSFDGEPAISTEALEQILNQGHPPLPYQLIVARAELIALLTDRQKLLDRIATLERERPIGNRFHCFGDIVKNSNGEKLPTDEPLFLIRARDHLAIVMLERYRKAMVEDSCNGYIMGLMDEIIAEFVRFKIANPDKMKQPGITRGL